MTRLQRAALVAELTRRLRERDGWAGETQVQKSVYFLQRMLGVPTERAYTLYKFGPFSFDLRDDLSDWRSAGFLALQPQRAPYGPRLTLGENVEPLLARNKDIIEQYDAELDFIADKLAPMRIGELERVATALYVTDDLRIRDTAQRAAKIHELKPHVSIDDATAGVQRLDDIRGAMPQHHG